MIRVNGTNVEVSGTMEQVVSEFIYLADGVSNKASEITGQSKKEWLDKVVEMVENGFAKEEDQDV